MNNKHYVGKRVSSFQRYDDIGPVTGIALVVDDENEYLAGDQNGYVLEVPCSYGTQAMANQLLAAVKGKVYKGYTADKAALTPGAELGDGVTVNGLYGLLASRSFAFGGGCYAAIAAPGENIIEHKYPIQSTESAKNRRSTNRKIAETRSSITKTAEEIRAEVANDVKGLNSTITQTADTLRGEITSSEDRSKSLIEQKVGSISLSVTNGQLGSSASIELSVDGKTQTKSIDMTNVRSAFANDNSAITISAGTVTFKSNTFVVDSTNFGVTAEGVITAKAGNIGGFTIGKSALYNGLSSLNGASNGVYLGTDGIALGGGRFKVTSDGVVNATSGEFDNVTIGGSSSFGGALDNAWGSIDQVDGSFVGEHTYGTLNNTSGSFTGDHSGGTLTDTGGTFTGTNSGTLTGTHSGGSVSGCTLSNGTGGTYVGTCSGSTLSSCTLGDTSLTGTSKAIFAARENGAIVTGPSSVILTGGGTQVTIQQAGIFARGHSIYCGEIIVSGDKTRAITTDHYAVRLLDAYETPLPTFSDYGTAVLDETGVFHITIDPIFAETVDDAYLPTVFLTKYGEGDIWVERAEHDIVTVRGTPGLRFAWETRYAQANAIVDRLRVMDFDYRDESGETDFEGEAAVDYEHSADNIDYALEGYEYFTATERETDYARMGFEYVADFERRLT